MKRTIRFIVFMHLAALLTTGCKEDPSVAALKAALKNSKRQADTDVTNLPEYNFSSFAGTIWKTKVKVAITDVGRYTGERVYYVTLSLSPEMIPVAK